VYNTVGVRHRVARVVSGSGDVLLLGCIAAIASDGDLLYTDRIPWSVGLSV